MESNNIIERYNKLFNKIHNAKTVDDIRNISDELNRFEVTYNLIDKVTVKKLHEKFFERMNAMIMENEVVYQNLKDKIRLINEEEYDYSKDVEVSQAVQAKVLELMSKLPKKKNLANTGVIAKTIGSTIKSGIIGSKAALELLKYPAYIDMVDERFRQQAYIGSKSAKQIEFETKKESELEKLNYENAQVFLQGFHLRNMRKKFVSSKKISYFCDNDVDTDISVNTICFNN